MAGEKILIVDDDDDIREVLLDRLKSMGYETFGAADALHLVTVFTVPGGSPASAISGVVFFALASALVVLMLPETAQRELETISAEDAPASVEGAPSRAGSA